MQQRSLPVPLTVRQNCGAYEVKAYALEPVAQHVSTSVSATSVRMPLTEGSALNQTSSCPALTQAENRHRHKVLSLKEDLVATFNCYDML